jgi:hypothetical protein
MYAYNEPPETILKNANTVKESVIFALEREGLLKEPAEAICAKYVVVVHKEGWFGRLFKRITGGTYDKDAVAVDVVKRV